MASKFDDVSLVAALDRSLRNAKHLRARDAAAVAAARALARKIDAWDVIVDWALEDASMNSNGRPAVPANDNVSLATFLKYMDSLGLLPGGEAVKPAVKVKAGEPRSALEQWRAKQSKVG